MNFIEDVLFGKDSEKTHEIRAFCRNHLEDEGWLGDFVRTYFTRGEEWAEDIKSDPVQFAQAKVIWDGLHELAKQEMVENRKTYG